MSVYIDTITFVWALLVLVAYSQRVVLRPSWISSLGFLVVSSYLVAQSGWTTAFFLGDAWGRDLSNYIWFIFNSLVLTLLTVLWYRGK